MRPPWFQPPLKVSFAQVNVVKMSADAKFFALLFLYFLYVEATLLLVWNLGKTAFCSLQQAN